MGNFPVLYQQSDHVCIVSMRLLQAAQGQIQKEGQDKVCIWACFAALTVLQLRLSTLILSSSLTFKI